MVGSAQNAAVQQLDPVSYQLLKDSIGTVVNFVAYDGGYEENGNIFIYNMHAYNVDRVELKDAQGGSINNLDIDQVMQSIDLQASRVWLQNPHGQTTPNYHEVQTENKARGEFETSLQSFLSAVSEVTVARTRNLRKSQGN